MFKARVRWDRPRQCWVVEAPGLAPLPCRAWPDAVKAARYWAERSK